MTPSDLLKAIGANEIEDIPPQDKTSRRWSHADRTPRSRQSADSCSNSRSAQA